MPNDLLRSLLGFLRERGGALLGLAHGALRKIRSLLGGARGLVGPLIKRAIAFVLDKVSPAVTAARAKVRGSFEALTRMVQAARAGAPPEPDVANAECEVDSPAVADERGAGTERAQRAAAESTETSAELNAATMLNSPAEPSGGPVDAGGSIATSSRAPDRQDVPPKSRGRAAGPRGGAPSELATLAPAIRRAFVKMMGPRRAPALERAAPAAS